MHTLPRTIVVLSLMGAAMVLTPLGVRAQEEQAQETCQALVSPGELPTGAAAVQVTLNLSRDVGEISGLETESPAGVKLADPADVPRADMAAEEAPEAIEMTGQNVWRIWINTENVEPGEHVFSVVGADGRCTANVMIQS